MEEFSSYKVADLRRELKIRGLAVTGTKGELLARLQEALTSDKPASDDSAMDDALLDEDSVLGEDDDDESAGDVESSDNETNTSQVESTSLLLSSPGKKVIQLSPQKKETVTKGVLAPASVAKVSTIPPSVISGSKSPEKKRNGAPEEAIEGETLAKKAKITINREPILPPVTAKTPVATSPTKQPIVAGSVDIKSANSITAPGGTAAVKLNTAALSLADRAKLRQQKFGVAAIATETKAVSSGGTTAGDPPKLKQRAERFGSVSVPTVTAAGKISLTTDEEARLAKRRERFAAQLNDAKPTAVDVTNSKEKRAERFGISAITGPATVSKGGDEKKVSRAARFGFNT